MKIIGEIFVGAIQLGDKVDITDPCYDKNVWCRMTEKCAPGEYFGYVTIADEEEWGKRVASIAIYKDDVKCELDDMDYLGTIGVDGGMAGFFNDKPDFSNDEWKEFGRESGIYTSDGEFDYSRNTYHTERSIFSQSGYGDGGYPVYASAERNAFIIEFIENEPDTEEEEDE